MFEELIRNELPKTARELYTIAKERQPQDCQAVKCPHNSYPWEWMHQMQRELHRIAIKDPSPERNAIWRLKPLPHIISADDFSDNDFTDI
jgi:hypothetical protein